jgi:heterodisulfide reductase subunit C
MMVEIKETVLEDGTVRREIPTEYRCYYCNGVINKVEYYRYRLRRSIDGLAVHVKGTLVTILKNR